MQDSRLVNCLGANVAVAGLTCFVTYRQTFLQDFKVKVAVFAAALGFIPNPNKISVARGVRFPFRTVRFNDDGRRGLQLRFGEVGSFFAPRFDSTRGFGGVDSNISCFQHTVFQEVQITVEVGSIAVDVLFQGNFFLQGIAAHIKFGFRNVVHRFDMRAIRSGVLRRITAVAVVNAATCKQANRHTSEQ